jgi:pyridoxamine---pyruvate transaminase
VRPPDFTLTAGPTMASPRVLSALGSPIIFDYDPVFLERFRATEGLLAEVYRTRHDVVLMQGEAVLGLEAGARALVRPRTRCLNLVSGVYASWFGDWLREFGADVSEVRVPYDEAIDPAAVKQALDDDGPFELVSLVHSETPSGVENPLAEIGPLAHDHGALMLADVVSSLGGTTVLIDDWHIDLAVAGPQKCLAGPPGMSLIAVSQRAWEVMESNPGAPRGSFLSLLDWKHRWIDGGGIAFPYTPSVSDVNGVHAALQQVIEEGLDAVIATHARAARACRAGVCALGLELWPRRESYAANCVTAVRAPSGVSVPEVLAHVRERYGVMLSGGYGELKERLFRLGHMGPASRSLYPLVAVSALGRGLADFGVSIDVGAGAQAAIDVLAEAAPVALSGSGS